MCLNWKKKFGRYENYTETANEFIKMATNSAKSHAKVKKLSDDMICAFNDALIDDCMQVYKLYLNKKKNSINVHILLSMSKLWTCYLKLIKIC